VVLMDLGLPVMDGHVATQRIRQWESEQHCPKPVVIVALTGRAAGGPEGWPKGEREGTAF